MPTRRDIMTGGLSLAALAAFGAHACPAFAGSTAPLGATAVTQVFGDGQRLTAVEIDFAEPLAEAGPGSFAVESRTVAGTDIGPGADGGADRRLTIDLSPDDPDAVVFGQDGREPIRRDAVAVVRRTGPIRFRDGETSEGGAPIATSAVRNEIVDDFRQLEFVDEETGLTLAYNLFEPRDADPAQAYPLVVFMHDAGATSEEPTTTLRQGLGAVVWASPQDQAERPAFVLAPQYARQVVNDRSEATDELAATVRLIEHIALSHPVDTARIYATGQSGGAMLAIAMNIAHPDLFAATFLVAGQWDPQKARPLARDRLWIVVSEGDLKAYPGQNEMTSVYEEEGAKVARAVWNGRASTDEFADDVERMRQEDAPINYVALARGTVVKPGQDDDGGSNHVNTWRIAYTIPGIRQWLFEQHR